MNKILEFFDELNICAEAKLCDEKTAIRFFGKYAWDFSGLMKPYVFHLREAYHDPMIGIGILRLESGLVMTPSDRRDPRAYDLP